MRAARFPYRKGIPRLKLSDNYQTRVRQFKSMLRSLWRLRQHGPRMIPVKRRARIVCAPTCAKQNHRLSPERRRDSVPARSTGIFSHR
jgi:hypothetical protein